LNGPQTGIHPCLDLFFKTMFKFSKEGLKPGLILNWPVFDKFIDTICNYLKLGKVTDKLFLNKMEFGLLRYLVITLHTTK
jgi:hypothetical protein